MSDGQKVFVWKEPTDLAPQSKAMNKTISLSALFLFAFPMMVLGQQVAQPESSLRPDSYFAQVPFQVNQGTPNHITGAQLDPNSASAQQARLAKATNELLSAHLSAAQALQNIRSIQQNEVPVTSVSHQAANHEIRVTENTIEPPTVAPQQFSAPIVNKPTPANSRNAVEMNRVAPQAPNQFVEESVPAQIDPMSIEQFQNQGRVEPWVAKQSRMRNVGDHFSPGGKPFAFPSTTGNSNFFCVDRKQCCDEWAGQCNCSGGLKVNPGHLGLPWLSSKENCDQTKKIGKRRHCECESCCSK